MTATQPGKRLLNQLTKLRTLAGDLLQLIDHHPELKSSKTARELRKALAQGAPKLAPRKPYTRTPPEQRVPGISSPAPGVLVHHIK